MNPTDPAGIELAQTSPIDISAILEHEQDNDG